MKDNVTSLQLKGAETSTLEIMTDVGILSIGADLAGNDNDQLVLNDVKAIHVAELLWNTGVLCTRCSGTPAR